MQKTILYAIALLSFIILVITLEWDKIKNANTKRVIIILIILFFLGSAISSLFFY